LVVGVRKSPLEVHGNRSELRDLRVSLLQGSLELQDAPAQRLRLLVDRGADRLVTVSRHERTSSSYTIPPQEPFAFERIDVGGDAVGRMNSEPRPKLAQRRGEAVLGHECADLA
jgi:hypothetical protein